MRFLYWILGWRRFSINGVSVYQRNVLIDQTVVGLALSETENKRSWCQNSRLSVFIENGSFSGSYGATATAELSRFRRFGNSATLKISSSMINYETLVKLLRGLNRVD